MSLCPHCKEEFTYVKRVSVVVFGDDNHTHAVSYNCPHCETSLSVTSDHLEVKRDIVTTVISAIKSDSASSAV
ncbi:putative protein YbaR (Trm112 family) [Rhodanobacter sp. Root179]|jgi:hypothetical protein